MKLRNKLILILSLVLLIFLFLEGFFGNLYFEKYFRYTKVLELEKIDFVSSGKIDYDNLKAYEKNQNALVMIYKDNKIVNLENFYYIKVKTQNGEAFVLLDAFLDNLYSNTPLKIENRDLVEITAIKVLDDYYLPTTLIKNNDIFKDYKFSYRSKDIFDIKGRVEQVNTPYTQSSLGDDFLESLLTIDVLKPQKKKYKDNDGDDEFQVITMNRDGYKVVIFYSFENIKDIFPSLKLYFYMKAIVIILLTIFIGVILEKIMVNPIVNLSKISEKIANLNFIKEIDYKSKDEIGTLYKDIFKMSEKLENIIELYRGKVSRNKEAQIKLEESIKLFMHEVKTPLSAIIGFSDLLLENESSEEIKIINSESKRILKMANTLLEENRYSQNEMILNKKSFSLISLIELSLKILETENRHINIDISHLKNMLIYGDREKLEQVMLNILKNSLEYAKKEIKIYTEEKNNEITLFLENDGPHIPNENLDKVWNKFFSSNSGDRGLGLYISSEILDAHGLYYGVNNSESGVQFFIVLKKGI